MKKPPVLRNPDVAAVFKAGVAPEGGAGFGRRIVKALLLTLGVVAMAPVAQAQVYPQAPAYPGYGYAGPYGYAPRVDYYEAERRRREEIRHEEWVRDHCFRDFRGEVVCRRY